MVAKHHRILVIQIFCIILAKIHMVAKLTELEMKNNAGIILAKIHMVAKHIIMVMFNYLCIILAKIHMVAKHHRFMYV